MEFTQKDINDFKEIALEIEKQEFFTFKYNFTESFRIVEKKGRGKGYFPVPAILLEKKSTPGQFYFLCPSLKNRNNLILDKAVDLFEATGFMPSEIEKIKMRFPDVAHAMEEINQKKEIENSSRPTYEITDAEMPEIIASIEDFLEKDISLYFQEKIDELYSQTKKKEQMQNINKNQNNIKTKEEVDDEIEAYTNFINSKIQKMNKDARDFFRNRIKFDQKNPVHDNIIDSFYTGKNPLLIGATGIGKTYSVKQIAEANRIPLKIFKGNKNSDESDLIGAMTLSQESPLADSERKVVTIYKEGVITKAIELAQKSPVILLIDEIGKMSDTTAIISAFENDHRGEITIATPQEERVFKVQTKKGGIWVKLSKTKSENTLICTEKNITIPQGLDRNETKITSNNNLNYIEERANRGDLLEIYIGDLLSNPYIKKNIIEEHSFFKTIYAPKRNLVFVGTANTGIKDASNDENIDPALASRMSLVAVPRPSYEFMCKSTLSEMRKAGLINWDDKTGKEVVEIIAKLLNIIKKKIDLDEDEIFSKVPDFRTVTTIFSSLDEENPFSKNSRGNLYSALKKSIDLLITLNPSMDAEEYLSSTYRKGLITIVEELEKKRNKFSQKFSKSQAANEVKNASPRR